MYDIIEYFQDLEPSNKNLLSEFGKIIELILVLPATNATSERSFSKLKLHSTMSQARLNHYMIFSVYKEHVDTLDLPAPAKEFVLRYPKRENIFEICT